VTAFVLNPSRSPTSVAVSGPVLSASITRRRSFGIEWRATFSNTVQARSLSRGSSVSLEELGRPAVHLLARELLDALAEHPLLAEGVAQAPGAVAVELVLE
jgi:hypothetical protein